MNFIEFIKICGKPIVDKPLPVNNKDIIATAKVIFTVCVIILATCLYAVHIGNQQGIPTNYEGMNPCYSHLYYYIKYDLTGKY